MAIRTERTGPTSVKIYDDAFGDKQHLRVSKLDDGSWIVRRYEGMYSSDISQHATSQEAVDAAVKFLKDALDELDAAIDSIS